MSAQWWYDADCPVSALVVSGAQPSRLSDVRAKYRGYTFRAPHHSVSAIGLLQELFIAYQGVIFFDELPEFRSAALGLVGRLRQSSESPIAVYASWAPCPCGDAGWACDCTEDAHAEYRQRVMVAIHAVGGVDNQAAPVAD